MRRITASMEAFRNAPENAASVIEASERSDEIGAAQRELAHMQNELRNALQQKTHLAALGAAVSKINHDLRNVLATAHLASDRLADSDDPHVRRATPTLVRAIDHAIAICTETLDFAKAEMPQLSRERFGLKALADDVVQHVELSGKGHVVWHNYVPADLEVEADREQLFRALLNLSRNAVDALVEGGEVTIAAAREDGWLLIDVADTGSGLPERARAHLFEPFSGSAKSGGVGLGLAISRELVRGHGGDLELIKSDANGTTFRVILPDVPELSRRPRRGPLA
jgi:signal transduction histidine kinase